MKKLSVIILMLSISFGMRTASYGATDSVSNGIHFEKGLSWKQIVAKATLEKKYILFDCYATWCGPCKKMDQEVYPVKAVGDYFNDKFISVRVQMDTSSNDDADIRSFYADAQSIKTKYRVGVYPTFLFFNSGGNLLNSTAGFMESAAFVKLAKDVTSPEKDYYHFLDEYNNGRRDLVEMGFLARTAANVLRDRTQAAAIAGQYLRALNKSDWFTKENIEFMRSFTEKPKDFGFAFFFNNAAKINDVMKNDTYAQGVIHNILYDEYITPEIRKKSLPATGPDWKKIAPKIALKYGKYYAERVIIGARANWAARKKQWPEHAKYVISYVTGYGPKTDDGGFWEANYLNTCAWDIFEHSKETAELNIALKWSLRAITIDPSVDWIDTYANILYKLKKTDLALKWEGIASAVLNHKDKGFEDTLTKMKEGVPTWQSN